MSLSNGSESEYMGEILSLLKSAAQNFPVTSEPRGRPPKDAPGAGQLCCTGQLQNLPSPALSQTLLDVQPISHTKAQTDLLHIYGTPQSPHPQSFFRHSLSPGASRSSARHLQPRCLPSTPAQPRCPPLSPGPSGSAGDGVAGPSGTTVPAHRGSPPAQLCMQLAAGHRLPPSFVPQFPQRFFQSH